MADASTTPTPDAAPDAAPVAVAPAEPKPEPTRSAPQAPEGKHYFWGTGRRKKAIARVRIRPGTGVFEINKRPMDQYFVHEKDRNAASAPLQAVRMATSWDIFVSVNGGGYTGQAGAVCLGLARAIAKAVPDMESALRDKNLMTRDARMSERKKPGQPGARRRFQFSKR